MKGDLGEAGQTSSDVADMRIMQETRRHSSLCSPRSSSLEVCQHWHRQRVEPGGEWLYVAPPLYQVPVNQSMPVTVSLWHEQSGIEQACDTEVIPHSSDAKGIIYVQRGG